MSAVRVLLAAGLLVAGGCAGYSSRRLEAFPGARTVAVVPFQNVGFRRDLDARLTQAVVEELRARTAYAIGAPGSADLVLEGTTDAWENVVLQERDRTVVQRRLSGVVRVTVRDGRTGAVRKRYEAYATAEFTPGRDAESLEGSATDAWTRRLAIRVVQGLEGGF